jgi:hypothetical protein
MAGKTVATYDPKKVIITFGGVPLSGFADGTFINVTGASDTFVKSVGADGEVARGRSNDETCEVTLTLMQTSLSNVYLNTVKEADKISSSGVKPLSITDLSGTGLMFWPQAWIRKAPDVEYAKEVGDRAWIFDTGQPGSLLV